MNDSISLIIGMDIGKRKTHVCVMDLHGVVLARECLLTKRAVLEAWFKERPRSRVALEVGRSSPWISRMLEELGHEVIVANPRKVRSIYDSDNKHDELDAEQLGRLARVDPKLLHPVRHRRKETQAALAILRSREAVVEQRTALINSVRGQVAAFCGDLPDDGTAATFHKYIDVLPEHLRDALKPLMEIIATLTVAIHNYDRQITKMCDQDYPATAVLRQVWGVGPTTSLYFVLLLEVPERFSQSRAVGAYFGLRPRLDQSGEVSRELHITKAGDRVMRRLLVQCAQRILSEGAPDTDLARWGHALADRGGRAAKRRATVAVARKLAVLLHRLWVTAEVYEPLRNSTQNAA